MSTMGFLVILLCIWITGTSADTGRCPDIVKKLKKPDYHVETFHDKCYAFYGRERTWIDANSHCKRLGAEMISITNGDIMNFVKRVLNSRSLGWTNRGVWNGANDIDGRGWKWTTGEKVRWSYWEPGEPSKMFGIFSFEDCSCMRRSDSWRWHDYPCDGPLWKYKYICQFRMLPPTTTTTTTTTSTTTTTTTVQPPTTTTILRPMIITTLPVIMKEKTTSIKPSSSVGTVVGTEKPVKTETSFLSVEIIQQNGIQIGPGSSDKKYNSLEGAVKAGSTAGDSAKQGSSFTISEKDKNKALLIGMVIGGVVLFSLIFLAVVILYRKKRRQKLQNEKMSVHFQNLAYAQLDQIDRDRNRSAGNMYIDTNTMNRLYEEINKQPEYGINTLGTKGACCTCEVSCSPDDTSDEPKECCFAKHSLYPDEPPPSYDEVTEAEASGGNEYVDMSSAGAKKGEGNLEPNNAPSHGRDCIDMRQKWKDTNLQAEMHSTSLLHKPSNLELTHIYNNEDAGEENDQIHQTEAKREEAYAQPSEIEPHLNREEAIEHDPVYAEIKDVTRPDENLLNKDELEAGK